MISTSKQILVFWPRYLSSQKLLFSTMLGHSGLSLIFVAKWRNTNPYNEKPEGYRELYSDRVTQWDFNEFRFSKLGFWDIIKMIVKINRKFNEKHWDLIITSTQFPLHSKISFCLAKIYRTKIAVYTEEWLFIEPKNIIERFHNTINNYVERNADYLLTQSAFKSQIYHSRRVDKKRTIVFPFLVNDYMIDKWQIRTKREPIKVLYLGRFIELKGIDVLLTAYQHLVFREIYCELILAGGTLNDLLSISPEIRNTYSLICESGKKYKIDVLGYLNESQKAATFNNTDIFIFPTKEREGWGISLMDATQSGAICIATNVVPAAYELIINGQNGFIVKPNDPEELANTIERCTRLSIEQFQDFSKKSRELFSKYNNVEKVSDILNDIA